MKRILLVPLLALLSFTASCQRDEAEYVKVNGKVFIFNVRLARAFYMLTLNRLEPLPDNAVVRAEFEDPAGGPPLISEQKVFAKMTRIDLQSPDLACVVADKPYAIHVIVRATDGKVLQTLDTTLTSTLDQTVLPAHALVLGAAYDRNPEAFGKDGKIQFQRACKKG
ncbi:hypothetical protein JJB09_04360 [Rhizobium sp. KVB221]|uniref:Uncharacterized protein n=1 Tax=Rhizobium setariae TaxID=2801340 RepID=A0A936YN94_9HYPH|nr:hypothetical protein [Rhizobium setariae]MBL0371254.1 hypothetical protein [Rhizobium setariae]